MTHTNSSKFDALRSLCRQHHVASLYAFGSRATEASEWINHGRDEFEATPSDLDLAVTLEAGIELSARGRVRLSIDLERLFEVPQVDLVLLWEADAFLAVEVIRGELLYCDDEDLQAREELFILRRAGDLAYFEEKRLAGILSGELRR